MSEPAIFEMPLLWCGDTSNLIGKILFCATPEQIYGIKTMINWGHEWGAVPIHADGQIIAYSFQSLDKMKEKA